MSEKPIWSGDMRKSPGRYYMALSPVPERYWTDHVLCSMAYEKDGAIVAEEVRLTAEEWFSLDGAGNFISGTVMTKPCAHEEQQ